VAWTSEAALQVIAEERPPFTFYLGTHETSWLRYAQVPLFVSHRRLMQRVKLPRAAGPWVLDSGGFTELSIAGRWTTTPEAYAMATVRYQREIGQLQWAAPQDWMCEPHILDKTGLSVRDHQCLTVTNLLKLRHLEPSVPWAPVLQGWTKGDYLQCVKLYLNAGVDLRDEPVVGVGSVCRRQDTHEIAGVFRSLAALGLRLHGFGVKTKGLGLYKQYLISADSMAWSYDARSNPPLPGCTTHKNCANCWLYAQQWRQRLLAKISGT
jgi:hypothetical protein